MESGVCAICGRTAPDVVIHLTDLVNKLKNKRIENIQQKEGIQYKDAMLIYTKEMDNYVSVKKNMENIGEEYKSLKISTVLDGKDVFKDIYELVNSNFIVSFHHF